MKQKTRRQRFQARVLEIAEPDELFADAIGFLLAFANAAIVKATAYAASRGLVVCLGEYKPGEPISLYLAKPKRKKNLEANG